MATLFFGCSEKSNNSSPNTSKNISMSNTLTETVIYQLKEDQVANYALIADATNAFF